MGDAQNTQARDSRYKKPIFTNLSKIGITEEHRRVPADDHLSFEENEADPHPYPRVLIVSVPVAGVIISKVLVDTGRTLNILFTNMFKWMGIPIHFLQPYPDMVLGLNGVLTTTSGSIKLAVEARAAPNKLG